MVFPPLATLHLATSMDVGGAEALMAMEGDDTRHAQQEAYSWQMGALGLTTGLGIQIFQTGLGNER